MACAMLLREWLAPRMPDSSVLTAFGKTVVWRWSTDVDLRRRKAGTCYLMLAASVAGDFACAVRMAWRMAERKALAGKRSMAVC
jgi:hypothetical protein